MQNRILVAAHQGVAGGGYLLGNTLDAFRAALKDGADIIELDAAVSGDNEVYTFHPDTESFNLGIENGSFSRMTSCEIKELRRLFPDGHRSPWPVYRLEESLDFLKGRCLVNIDKSWTCLPQVVRAVRRVGVEDQVILKSNIRGNHWLKEIRAVEELAPGIRYMPVFYEKDIASDIIREMSVFFYGAELCFTNEKSELADPAFLEKMHRFGLKLWVNAIVFHHEIILSAGHDDNISRYDPESGWGWLAERGYDIIQTDWVLHCRQFLDKIGR